MFKELKSLQDNETWEEAELPADRKPIGCRWVFRRKYDATGTLTRYKARLVAQAFSQRYGLNYTETFSPVAKLSSIRILTALAARAFCLSSWLWNGFSYTCYCY